MKAATLLLALMCGLAQAQVVQTLIDHGEPANRLDLVMVGDGYTAAEAGKFRADANGGVEMRFRLTRRTT